MEVTLDIKPAPVHNVHAPFCLCLGNSLVHLQSKDELDLHMVDYHMNDRQTFPQVFHQNESPKKTDEHTDPLPSDHILEEFSNLAKSNTHQTFLHETKTWPLVTDVSLQIISDETLPIGVNVRFVVFYSLDSHTIVQNIHVVSVGSLTSSVNSISMFFLVKVILLDLHHPY